MGKAPITRRRFLARGGAAAIGLAAGAPMLRQPAIARSGGSSMSDLRTAVQGQVLTAASTGYDEAARVFNQRWDGAHPLAIVRAESTADVRAAVRWAGRRDARVVARSGGHSYAGYSTGTDALVIDVGLLRSVSFEPGTGIATIGPGAQLIDVYLGLAEHGVTIPAGSCPSVGLAGLAQGGGMGLAGRKLGLTCDNVQELTLVTADGRARRASATMEEDLFWACRGGGGGNFGIATEFRLTTHPVDTASHFYVTYPFDRADEVLSAWQELAPSAPDELTSLFSLDTTNGEAPLVSTLGQFFGSQQDLEALIEPLTSIVGASAFTDTLAYGDLMLLFAGCSALASPETSCHTEGTRPGGVLPRQRFVGKSDYVTEALTADGRQTLIGAIEARQEDGSGGTGAILLDAYGGAINRVDPHETAFVHRHALFSTQYYATFPSGSLSAARTWARSAWTAMRTHVSGRAYQNYIDPDLDGWERAYYGSNLRRLRRIKGDVDPDFRFRFPQAIRPG